MLLACLENMQIPVSSLHLTKGADEGNRGAHQGLERRIAVIPHCMHGCNTILLSACMPPSCRVRQARATPSVRCNMGINLDPNFHLTSPAFEPGGAIPVRYTREGDNVSPPLQWTGTPADAAELVLICHDPDAPLIQGATHWVLYGIPPNVSQLPENVGARYLLGARTSGDCDYSGPMPPPGDGPHHYYFWLYATNSPMNLEAGLTRKELLGRLEHHVLAQTRLVGTYQRP